LDAARRKGNQVTRRASLFLRASLALIPALAIAAYEITPDSYLAHIKYLASPELKGRRTGTPELNKAADYIETWFKKAGLQPLAPHYFDNFEVTARTGLGKGDKLSLDDNGKQTVFKQQQDFVPINLSANGTAHGPIVFAGYGITAPEYHYDDYQGVDVKDKIVLLLRHEPQEADEKSVFEGKNFTVHSQISSKLVNAKLHGARGVLLVNDTPNHPGDEDQLDKFQPLVGIENYGIVLEQIKSTVADEILASSKQSLKDLAAAIDKDTKPHSFLLPASITASITVDLAQQKKTVHNVVGYFPGQTNEYVVIGAHYDHLGKGEQDSLAPSLIGTVHPGADDNASGTSGVIELARHIAASGQHKRGFLFICFAGEEEGLLGSAYYVNHPLKPLSDAAAMINMDMIGRLRDNKVYVGGVGTGSTFKALLQSATKNAGFQSDESEVGGYGSSDHTSFTTKQIPTLFFFSGLHTDYHKPSDTWDKINAKDAVRLLGEISEIALALADAPERPTFVRVAINPHAGGVAPGGGGYGPDFGSIPDFGGPAHGVRFADIRAGSPADKAGLKPGDVLIEFDGKPIENLYDFTYALRSHKPGDTVVVKVLRDGKPLEVKVLLTKRN
jgi:Peptidase family M28/PDZ domain/PA domain